MGLGARGSKIAPRPLPPEQTIFLPDCILLKVRRLLVLIVEVEQPEGLSSRKLIIESMKHNVVTAYSGPEAVDLLNRMRPDLVMVHGKLRIPSCQDLVASIQESYAGLPVAVMSPTGERCSTEDFQINSLEPSMLVRFFQQFSQEIIGKQPFEHPSTQTIGSEQVDGTA